MDYYVFKIVPSKLKVNKDSVKKLNSKQFQNAMAIASTLDWNENMLVVRTFSYYDMIDRAATLKNYLEASKGALRIAEFQCATFFVFENPKLITNGATDQAVQLIENLIHLGQAHSLGILSVRLEENKLPFGGVEVSNLESSKGYILEFLDKVRTK